MFKQIKKIQYNSPVILTYTLISMVALFLSFLTNGKTNLMFFSVYRSKFSIGFLIRMVGHAIGHISLEHFVSNFVTILLIGPMLEEKYGSKLLLAMMLFTALITGSINIVFSNNILLGASGIAFMLMILASFANIKENKIPLTFILIIFIFIGREAYLGFTSNDNISRITHIVGGVCGGVLGFYINDIFIMDKINKKDKEIDLNKK